MALVPPFHSENEVHCGVVWRLRRTTAWTLRRTGEALTVTTLNARRPWYSYSQSDWIKKDKVSEFTGATYNFSIDTLRERRWIGRKEYELTDHLGNVLVTFLDRKTGYGNANGNYVGFNADIASITDYYPFGMPIEERSVINGGGFRFGWNTHEKVNEIAGIGNHTTAEFGEFDTRLGRRWNPDPKSGLMPNESPYAVNHGNPIAYKDPKGDFGFIGAAIGAVAGAVIEYGSQAASNLIQGKSLKDALWNEIDFADVGVSAAVGALAGTTGGASLIITRVTAGAVRASVDYTPEKKWKYIGGKNEKEKKVKEFLLDAGSELVGGAVGTGFDKAGLKEFVRKPPRSLFKGGAKQASKALGDEVATGTVETAIPTIIDGAVRGALIEVEPLEPVGYEDNQTGKLVPFNSTPSQTKEK